MSENYQKESEGNFEEKTQMSNQNNKDDNIKYDHNPIPINEQNNNSNNNNDNNNKNSINTNQLINNNLNLTNNKKYKSSLQISNQDKNIDIKPYFEKVSRTGLLNLEDTSYLNVILQLLGQTREFAEHFLIYKNYYHENIKEMPLSFVTSRLYTHIYKQNNNEVEKYKPYSYLRVLGVLNKLYTNNKRKNANELLIFILDSLHKEMVKKMKIDNYNDNYQNNYYVDSVNTIISQVFYLEQSTVQYCCKCYNKSDNKILNFNTFDLDILKPYKLYSNNIFELKICDCLDLYFQDKSIKLFCDKCNQYQPHKITSKLDSTTENILFLLDRGDNFDNLNNVLFKINFLVEKEIDISKYLNDRESPKKFKLNGIVCIVPNEKKYVFYCKSSIDNKCYFYDDENVEFISDNEIDINDLRSKNDKSYIPCILYYKSCKI